MIALVCVVVEDIGMLFIDDDFEDDDSRDLMRWKFGSVTRSGDGSVTPPPLLAVPLRVSTMVGDPSMHATEGHAGNPTCVDWWMDMAHDPKAPNDCLWIRQD
ncbi:hypothetical protein Tco_1015294 [Tanacetum coccineum]|uniref:Uncharacterized protein n=1 Tax=Tanacetum coccineum TaxID=301880 RepID=A0ABQ5FLH5_9ASTR